MIKTLLILFTFFQFSVDYADATVWIAIGDRAQNKIGVIGMSSGHIGKDTFALIDNEAMVAIGSWYLPKSKKKLSSILYKNISTEQMVRELSVKANSFEGLLPRRITLIRNNFEASSFAGPGCHNDNYYCGEVVGNNYAITGGGLTSPDVIFDTEKTILSNSNRGMQLECQLLSAMKTLSDKGGEWKLFERLVIATDNLGVRGDSKLKVYKRKKRHENELFSDLRKSLRKKKIYCP